MTGETYRALVASEESNGLVAPSVKELNISSLPANEVLIQVKYSSLNYKDALSATGTGASAGVIRTPRASMPAARLFIQLIRSSTRAIRWWYVAMTLE
mgnify:CR=1 FL=1